MRYPSPRSRHAIAIATFALALQGCGAKTPLDQPDVALDSGVRPDVLDAVDIVDVVDVTDVVDITPPPMVCAPVRLHTTVGAVTTLQPNVSAVATTGYVWRLVSQPPGQNTMIFDHGGSLTAVMTPGAAGEYDINVTVPGTGGALVCSIVVIAVQPDPRCPGYALAEPTLVSIPGGDMQVGYDVAWRAPRTTQAGSTGAIFSDDPDARVAAVVFERVGTVTGHDAMTTLQLEGNANEQPIQNTLMGVPVLVGRTGTTHEAFPLRRSTFRITPSMPTTPSALRDQLAQAIASVGPPAMPAPSFAAAADFYVEIATIVRADTQRVVTGVTVSPVIAYDDPSTVTAIRVEDFANATEIARAGDTIDVQCSTIVATRVSKVDFLWFVDTTDAMIPYQTRIGNEAQSFFQQLQSAGADFRVAVIEAGNSTINFGTAGSPTAFRWINGTDPMGALKMAYQVTIDPYPGPPMHPEQAETASNNLVPYPTLETEAGDGHEEPIAQSIVTLQEFDRQRRAGATNPDFLLRPDAVTAVFYVTLESASDDDYEAYFEPNASLWGGAVTPADAGPLVNAIVSFYRARSVLPFGLIPTSPDWVCPSVPGLAQCVITASGGAYAPIDAGGDVESDRQIQTAIERVAETVTGASSEFVLPVIPISASLRVRVQSRLAPRSRVDGFDYDETSRAIVLRGRVFHPQIGQTVQAAYFVWQPAR